MSHQPAVDTWCEWCCQDPCETVSTCAMLKQRAEEKAAEPRKPVRMRDEFLENFVGEMEELWGSKGLEYTVSKAATDRLYNFRKVAELTGQSMKQVFISYYSKHYFSICNWVKTGSEGVEGIRGRFLDMAVYSVLGAMIAAEVGNEIPEF